MIKARRTAAKLIRYTPEEINLVADRARACGRPVACYVRECSLGALPRARRAHGDAEVIRSLARIGNVLSDLARQVAGEPRLEPVELKVVLDELLAVIRQIG